MLGVCERVLYRVSSPQEGHNDGLRHASAPMSTPQFRRTLSQTLVSAAICEYHRHDGKFSSAASHASQTGVNFGEFKHISFMFLRLNQYLGILHSLEPLHYYNAPTLHLIYAKTHPTVASSTTSGIAFS